MYWQIRHWISTIETHLESFIVSFSVRGNAILPLEVCYFGALDIQVVEKSVYHSDEKLSLLGAIIVKELQSTSNTLTHHLYARSEVYACSADSSMYNVQKMCIYTCCVIFPGRVYNFSNFTACIRIIITWNVYLSCKMHPHSGVRCQPNMVPCQLVAKTNAGTFCRCFCQVEMFYPFPADILPFFL